MHIMRNNPDFIRELDFVAELDGQVIGNVMYTKATLTDESGTVKDILTFGPVSITPEHQRRGYGKQLLEHSFRRAEELGWDIAAIQRRRDGSAHPCAACLATLKKGDDVLLFNFILPC